VHANFAFKATDSGAPHAADRKTQPAIPAMIREIMMGRRFTAGSARIIHKGLSAQ
jgi:hypothetical protein